MNISNCIGTALLGFSLFFVAMPAPAAQVASNGRMAKELVKSDGYIIFSCPDGWDGFGRKRCEMLIADKLIQQSAGDAVLMLYPVPEVVDEEQRRRLEDLRGELKIPGAWSYPALIFIDPAGWHYATLTGREVSRGTVEELAALIRDRIQKGRQRRSMEAKAFSPSTDAPTRARLRFDAHNIDGLTGMDSHTRNAIRADDPQDSTGVIRATDFNAYGFANNIGRNGVEAGMDEVDRMLADPAYTPRQKQQMCAAALGMLRRDGGPACAKAMRRYAEQMQQLVPDSPEGRAAERILNEWVPELRYGRGWHPGCIPTTATPVEVVGALPIREAGTYTVRLEYRRGEHSIGIQTVELYDGEKKIAEDRHWAVAGYRGENNVYHLKVPARVKEPHLFITIGQASRNSWGDVLIEKE